MGDSGQLDQRLTKMPISKGTSEKFPKHIGALPAKKNTMRQSAPARESATRKISFGKNGGSRQVGGEHHGACPQEGKKNSKNQGLRR